MEIKKKLEPVFKKYRHIYNKIFYDFYPTIIKSNGESNGFVEKNMTVNFSKAYEKKNKKSISWFEFPLTSNVEKQLMLLLSIIKIKGCF